MRYEEDEAVPDYEYGYGDALRDGRVVRPVYFPRTGGQMEWTAPDGTATRRPSMTRWPARSPTSGCARRCRVDGEWLPSVLREAVDRLADVRRAQPDAGGLVIAIDQDHARGIAELLRAAVPGRRRSW